nr:10493_t:CDS:2 [Entrophospora candida]
MNSLFSKFRQYLTPNYHHPSSKQYVNREFLKRKREQASRVGNYFAITQKRSTIGLPQTSHRVMEALGLRKIGHTVYHSQTPYIVGMIIKVKELLSVRMIDRIPSLEERSKRAESVLF